MRCISIRLLLASLLGAAILAPVGLQALPAFPGAEGFGGEVTGGRRGQVYHVTTLADAGPGSLREAVSAPGRLVVFDLSGIIRLKQNIELSSDLTIAGESSPNEGISLYGAGVSVTGKSNIILRFLHFRSGISSDRGKKALGIDRSDHIVVDHCSIEWGRWDDLGITVGSHDITIQYCLIAEAIHPQSFGALIDTVTNVTLSHNLWMSNESRNPKAKGTIQYINNVVYNWAITGLCGGHSGGIHLLDVIGNYFVKGPSSNDNFAGQFLATDHVYQSGNYVDLDRDGKLTGRLAANGDFHEVGEGRYTLPTFVESPSMHPSVPVTIQLAAEAFATVIAEAGCSLHRDSVDRRLIAEASSLGTKGSTLAHTDARGEALSGGLETIEAGKAPVDSDHDGIPDEWELAHHLDPANPADAAALGATGYTHLEEYWHDLVRNQGSHQPRAKQ